MADVGGASSPQPWGSPSPAAPALTNHPGTRARSQGGLLAPASLLPRGTICGCKTGSQTGKGPWRLHQEVAQTPRTLKVKWTRGVIWSSFTTL